jgi:hypothetical protein
VSPFDLSDNCTFPIFVVSLYLYDEEKGWRKKGVREEEWPEKRSGQRRGVAREEEWPEKRSGQRLLKNVASTKIGAKYSREDIDWLAQKEVNGRQVSC